MRSRWLPLLALLCGACELSEITVADADDVIIAEIVLRAGDTLQTAYLHRTATGGRDARVLDATVVVRNVSSPDSIRYIAEADSLCVYPTPPPAVGSTGTCYVARVAASFVQPGGSYELSITADGDRRLRGVTQVPGAFRIVRPAPPQCELAPNTVLELLWTRAEGASVYVTEVSFDGLREALRAAGQVVPDGPPVELIGLSVSASDTTLSFPSDLGLFDRFDDELFPLLVAIRSGLPAGVAADVTIAAADRNYVNWVRGGNFNPSGVVRISSIQGEGRGVFGSVVLLRRHIATEPGHPPCGTGTFVATSPASN